MINWITHESEALAGFPMGDPHQRTFPIYLPPGYDKRRKEPYPLVFLLAGWGSKSAKYIADDSAFDLSLPARFDRAISSGKMRSFIGVFPDGTSKFGCSQYINSPSLGKYQDYLCDEIVHHMDVNYHTFGDANHRIIAGHSSGGYGALVAGIQRPDCFRYVCSSAGDSFFELSLLPMVNRAIIELERAGGVDNFIKRFFEEASHSSTPSGQIETLLLLNMCACYAPNPTLRPLFGDVFFNLATGELIESVWKRFQNWDPVYLISAFKENVNRLQFVLLESGAQDQHALQLGHRQIARKLVELGVPHDLVEYPGGHSGHHWRFESRIQRILSLMPC